MQSAGDPREKMSSLGGSGGRTVLRFLSAQNPRSLFKVLNKLPRFGVGRKVTRVCWNVEDRENKINPPYWTITKVLPNEVHRAYKSAGFRHSASDCALVRHRSQGGRGEGGIS